MDKADQTIVELLEEVHLSLRRGDLSDLERLTAAMEAAEAAAPGASAEELKAISGLAERNARTLLAAQSGIKAARRRIGEVLSVARGAVAYDREGHRIGESGDRELARRF